MWPQQLRHRLETEACVLVTLNQVSGSSPRESGARMVVAAGGTHGSIGGGNLEYQATQHAHHLLEKAADRHAETELIGLGPALNQCCGGAVAIRHEVFRTSPPRWLNGLADALDDGESALLISAAGQTRSTAHAIRRRADVPETWPMALLRVARHWLDTGELPDNPNAPSLLSVETPDGEFWCEAVTPRHESLFLFGAGHVGRAVVRALDPLPFNITWVDSRAGMFPEPPANGVECRRTDHPQREVATAPAGSLFLVMTHSHAMDEDICHAVLARGNFAWLGLIGSDTKRRRFEHRLQQRGLDQASVRQLVCPVGLGGVRGKQPATIAVSIAAQLLQERPQRQSRIRTHAETAPASAKGAVNE